MEVTVILFNLLREAEIRASSVIESEAELAVEEMRTFSVIVRERRSCRLRRWGPPLS